MDEPLSRAEALVAVATCAAYADGSMGAAEDDEFTQQLQSCHALRGLDEGELRAALMKVDAIARKHGDAALLARAAAALPQELRATAFYLGVDLVVADEQLAAEERGFITSLRKHLDVPEALAAQIVEVVAIRRRG